jgi:hypothetical protein
MRNDRLRSGTGPLPHSYTQLLRKIILEVQLCPLAGSNSERMKFSGPDIPNPLPPEQPTEPPRPSPSPLPGHPPPGLCPSRHCQTRPLQARILFRPRPIRLCKAHSLVRSRRGYRSIKVGSGRVTAKVCTRTSTSTLTGSAVFIDSKQSFMAHARSQATFPAQRASSVSLIGKSQMERRPHARLRTNRLKAYLD